MAAGPDDAVALARLADEQAALRRVSRLVTHGAAPAEIFLAVAREVGLLVDADVVHLARYEHGGVVVALAGWARDGETLPAGSSAPYAGRNISGEVLRTGRPVRIDDYEKAFGFMAERVRSLGLSSGAGAPVVIEGRVWGVVIATSKDGPLPPGTEHRIAAFTELIATALTNAAAQEKWKRLTHEPAALERVSAFVARAVPADELLTAVAAEIGTLHDTDLAAVARYEREGRVTVLSVWESRGAELRSGAPPALEHSPLWEEIWRHQRPTRTAPPYVSGYGPLGVLNSAGCPIVVDGEIWGALSVHTAGALSLDTGSRLASFAELVAAAVSNDRARREARRLTDEQSALRRVATLVAREPAAEDVFDRIAYEMRTLLNVEDVRLSRFDGDMAEIVALSGPYADLMPVGARYPLDQGLTADVRRTGRPRRVDDDEVDRDAVDGVRGHGYRSIVGVPLTIDGRMWGVLLAGAHVAPLERGIEERLLEFGELMAVAVANVQAREELAASRARLVAAADDERRRVVRDLHDGAQQRLVHATVTLKLARDAVQRGDVSAIGELVCEALDQAEQATREMRELAHGIMPGVLTQGGLEEAIRLLVQRAPLPVEHEVTVGRLPPPVEATAYFVIAEALTNVAKHAQAHRAAVSARLDGDVLQIEVRDDGVGGAGPLGTGLVGLADRVNAFGGALAVESREGAGTRIAASIPIRR